MKRRDVRQGRRLEPVAALERPWIMHYDLPTSVIANLGQLLCGIGIHDLTLIEVVSSSWSRRSGREATMQALRHSHDTSRLTDALHGGVERLWIQSGG